jgi:hypothetical protein
LLKNWQECKNRPEFGLGSRHLAALGGAGLSAYCVPLPIPAAIDSGSKITQILDRFALPSMPKEGMLDASDSTIFRKRIS